MDGDLVNLLHWSVDREEEGRRILYKSGHLHMTKGMTDRMKKPWEIIRNGVGSSFQWVNTTLAMVYVAFSNKGVVAVLVAGWYRSRLLFTAGFENFYRKPLYDVCVINGFSLDLDSIMNFINMYRFLLSWNFDWISLEPRQNFSSDWISTEKVSDSNPNEFRWAKN